MAKSRVQMEKSKMIPKTMKDLETKVKKQISKTYFHFFFELLRTQETHLEGSQYLHYVQI